MANARHVLGNGDLGKIRALGERSGTNARYTFGKDDFGKARAPPEGRSTNTRHTRGDIGFGKIRTTVKCLVANACYTAPDRYFFDSVTIRGPGGRRRIRVIVHSAVAVECKLACVGVKGPVNVAARAVWHSRATCSKCEAACQKADDKQERKNAFGGHVLSLSFSAGGIGLAGGCGAKGRWRRWSLYCPCRLRCRLGEADKCWAGACGGEGR